MRSALTLGSRKKEAPYTHLAHPPRSGEMKHKTCHRCGNIRSENVACPTEDCPIIYCKNCHLRAVQAYGPSSFVAGCPVCKNLCCCSNAGPFCLTSLHCYRRCKFPCAHVPMEETENEAMTGLMKLAVQVHHVAEAQECSSLFTGDDSSLSLSSKAMDTTD